jgi:hypothetical protein
MKKSHAFLLIVTLTMALLSAYSLAAINQVYTIDFEWYSQYYNKYISVPRHMDADEWKLKKYPSDLNFGIIEAGGIKSKINLPSTNMLGVINNDSGKYVYLYAGIEKASSPEYRLKFMDIAQRGNVVEIRVSLNSPSSTGIKSYDAKHSYHPLDIIRINNNAFPFRGKLYFIFKNQYGEHLFEKYYFI